MKLKFLKKYFSIIFVVATLIGVFHHHNDLKQHNDCQICSIQSSIADADTPIPVTYLSTLDIYIEATVSSRPIQKKDPLKNSLQARAPPLFS